MGTLVTYHEHQWPPILWHHAYSKLIMGTPRFNTSWLRQSFPELFFNLVSSSPIFYLKALT
eukprot:987056-Pelagomonas_calceolata.AAC.6